MNRDLNWARSPERARVRAAAILIVPPAALLFAAARPARKLPRVHGITRVASGCEHLPICNRPSAGSRPAPPLQRLQRRQI
jgi:hypothetical protein